MLIKRKSPLTGQINEMEVDCTQEEYEAWQRGALIQDAMPRANADQREFCMTGYTPEDWAKIFPKQDDELIEDDDE